MEDGNETQIDRSESKKNLRIKQAKWECERGPELFIYFWMSWPPQRKQFSFQFSFHIKWCLKRNRYYISYAPKSKEKNCMKHEEIFTKKKRQHIWQKDAMIEVYIYDKEATLRSPTNQNDTFASTMVCLPFNSRNNAVHFDCGFLIEPPKLSYF